MNAAEVLEVLHKRWPDSEYLTIHEAPDNAHRQGRKIDLLAISLWRSRGYEIDAVEVKVSASDWARKVKDPSKADFWWEHSHRFWVAVPAELVAKVRDTLPEGWGLLAVGADSCRVAVQAKKHDSAPLGWTHAVGLLRAASDAGVGALDRARRAGWDQGYERAKQDLERSTGDVHLRRQLEELRTHVAAFEEASGVDMRHFYSNDQAAEAGRLYRFAREAFVSPERTAADIFRMAKSLEEAASTVRTLGQQVGAALHGTPA